MHIYIYIQYIGVVSKTSVFGFLGRTQKSGKTRVHMSTCHHPEKRHFLTRVNVCWKESGDP